MRTYRSLGYSGKLVNGVLISDSADTVPAVFHQRDYVLLRDLIEAGDQDGLTRMVRAGLAFFIPNGTKARVPRFTQGFFTGAYIRVTSGPLQGATGMILPKHKHALEKADGSPSRRRLKLKR